jgi:L-arabinose isomerase
MSSKVKKFEKPTAGLLLIGSPRFKDLGEGLKRSTYGERKNFEVEGIIGPLEKFINVVFPGIIYEKEEIQNAMDIFYNEKVDFVVAEFLSWSEDFAWIRFLRDMPDIPILFVNPVKDKMSFTNTLDEDDFIEYLCSGTLVGSLEASGSIPRTDRKNVRIVMGSREEIQKEIIRFSKPAQIRSILRQSTFGLLANYNEAMWSTYMDPYNLFTRIGPELRFVTYSALAEEISNIPEAETKEYQNELISNYKVMDDVEDDKFFAYVLH